MDNKNTTDLERLHMVHEMLAIGIKPPRRFGYTYYACHELCGQLEVCEHELIPVYVLKAQRIDHFISVFKIVLEEHDIQMAYWDKGNRRIVFKNNTNMVKFITRDWLIQPKNNLIWAYPDIDPHGYGVEDLG